MMKVLTCKNSAKSLESPDVNVRELGEALQLFSENFLFFFIPPQMKAGRYFFLVQVKIETSREVSWHPAALGGVLNPTTAETSASASTLFQSANSVGLVTNPSTSCMNESANCRA